MFFYCSSLPTLDLSGFNTENVTDMGAMFKYCLEMEKIDVAKFNTEKVTNMRGMFSGCRKITSLDLSHFNTENVTNTNTMFFSCDAITSLNLSSFKLEKVTDMGSMFFACEKMKTIYCDYTWKCAESTSMFAYCSKLKGAVAYDENKVDVQMANPETGYFTKKTPSGIEKSVDTTDAKIVDIYSLDGKKHSELQNGVNIVRMSNGKVQKIMK